MCYSNMDLHCVKHKNVIPQNWSHFDSIKKIELMNSAS